ncbi:hypothetical protein BDV93DRAFT_552779 [Ceratobasidium sp. AG-I]|nr:hypothetical protein BDV93DRAFT_552779 [Ceratobasidium sp. AG-I]
MDLFFPLLGKRNANAAHLDPAPARRPPPPAPARRAQQPEPVPPVLQAPPPAYVAVAAAIEQAIAERERPMKRHHVHFYGDGNLNFEVQGVHFRVHQSILSKHSSVFKNLNRAMGQRLISINWSAETFALLLDLLYPDRSKSVVFTTTRQAVNVYLLAREYKVTHVQTHCRRFLRGALPASKDGVFQTERSQRYRDDPTLAPAVLKCKIRELIPWAVYHLAIQLTANLEIDAEQYRPPQTMAIGDLQGRQLYQLFVVQRMNQSAYAEWNDVLEEFYVRACPRTTGRNKRCSRTVRDIDAHYDSPLFVSAQRMDGDAAKVLAELHKEFEDGSANRNHEHTRGWCQECVSGLLGDLKVVLTDMEKHLLKCATAFA